jgi:hypothetical protein
MSYAMSDSTVYFCGYNRNFLEESFKIYPRAPIDYRCDDEKKKTLELGRHVDIIA